MDCTKCLRLMSSFLEGGLSPRTRGLVSSHLDTCSKCGEKFRQVSLLMEKLRDQERAQLPAHFFPRLSHALDEVQPAPVGRRLVPKLAFGLASLLVILTISIIRLKEPTSDMVSEGLRMSDETLYLSPSESEGGEEAFSIRARSLNGDSIVYLLPSSPPKVRATYTSY